MLHLAFVAALVLQQQPPVPPPTAAPPSGLGQQEALTVYLSCDRCDFDFLRTEITFVNYVRDRHDAQVYVLVTTQPTGGGGTEYEVTFIGQGPFEGQADTLRYVSRPTDAPEAVRQGLARVLKLGLVRFVARTPLAEEIDIQRRQPPTGAGPTRQPHDPWNYWVFRFGLNGNLQAETSTNYRWFSGSVSANRTTEDWKIRLSVSGSNTRNSYKLTDTSEYVSRTHGYSFSGLAVRSLGRRWSAGARTRGSSSTYTNQKLSLFAGPALEFDVFPYSESTRRQLRINYGLGLWHYRYDERTIFGKTEEMLFDHELEIGLAVVQRWGTVNASISGKQYLYDLRKYNAGIYGGVDLRVVRGLSVSAYASYNLIRDQLYLSAAGATPEEILVRQRQLATQYSYFTFFGLSYTFGSIYNNVVNPRFGSSSSGGVTISF